MNGTNSNNNKNNQQTNREKKIMEMLNRYILLAEMKSIISMLLPFEYIFSRFYAVYKLQLCSTQTQPMQIYSSRIFRSLEIIPLCLPKQMRAILRFFLLHSFPLQFCYFQLVYSFCMIEIVTVCVILLLMHGHIEISCETNV